MLWGASVALLLATAPALAQNSQGQDGQGQNSQGQNSQGGTRSAPEFDPAVAGVVGAIVAGGGLLLARRRRR
jgi:LPXTG-motif cell wall-anchored protein